MSFHRTVHRQGCTPRLLWLVGPSKESATTAESVTTRSGQVCVVYCLCTFVHTNAGVIVESCSALSWGGVCVLQTRKECNHRLTCHVDTHMHARTLPFADTPTTATCSCVAAPLSGGSAMSFSSGSCSSDFGRGAQYGAAGARSIQREHDQQRSAFLPVTGASSRRRHRRGRSGGRGGSADGGVVE